MLSTLLRANIFLSFFLVYVKAEEPEFYTAAVLEYVRFGDEKHDSSATILETNLKAYKQTVELAAANAADIVIFPEYGLFPHDKKNKSSILAFAEDVPNPKKELRNPCNEKDEFAHSKILSTLSCFAKHNKIYIVANMADVKKCRPNTNNACDASKVENCEPDDTKCPPDGLKVHNTNVVFDRKGTIISRYYKIHLFFEPDVNPPDVPESAYFDTDFGVTFTTFICFDIVYKEAIMAVESKKVTNVAFPTYWYDHMPAISSMQFHQGWAIRNNVNLLAANVHLPGTGTMGSAIYSGTRGALIHTFNPDGKTKLLISKVPKRTDYVKESFVIPKGKFFIMEDGKFKEINEEVSKFSKQCSRIVLGPPNNFLKDYRCFEINTTQAEMKKLTGSTGTLSVCNKQLCCSLKYEAKSMNEEYYLLAFNDVENLYETYSFCSETCTIVRCDSLGKRSCATFPISSDTAFKFVELTGNFTSKYVFPSVLENGMKLTPIREWTYKNDNIAINFDSETEGLLSVGLYGRCYDHDSVF